MQNTNTTDFISVFSVTIWPCKYVGKCITKQLFLDLKMHLHENSHFNSVFQLDIPLFNHRINSLNNVILKLIYKAIGFGPV